MGKHTGPIIARHDGLEVIDCSHCGWAHLTASPTAEELADLYRDAYWERGIAPFSLEKFRAEKRFWNLEHADKLADWGGILGREAGAVLDVGCGNGMLLEHAAAHGWRAVGIEPSAHASANARAHGLTVHTGMYEDIELPVASFDVVHIKDVLEHLPDPAGFVAWAARLLVGGGVLTIQVPNDFNQLQEAARTELGLDPWWVGLPHLNYFSFESVERLVTARGFTPVGRDTNFPMEWFLLMGDDYVRQPAVGASAHQRRMLLEQRLETVGERRPLHADLARRGLGREVIVHARRVGGPGVSVRPSV